MERNDADAGDGEGKTFLDLCWNCLRRQSDMDFGWGCISSVRARASGPCCGCYALGITLTRTPKNIRGLTVGLQQWTAGVGNEWQGDM